MAKSVRQKEINFLTVLSGRKSKKRLDPRSLIMPGVLLVLVIAGVGVFGLLHTQTAQIEAESNSIRDYLNAPDTSRQLSEAEAVSAQADNMTYEADSVARPMENLSTYPDMTSQHYSKIFELSGANIELSGMTFNRTTGVLSFSATSSYVLSIPTFIQQLRTSGLFLEISYTGYAGNSNVSQLSSSTSRTDTTSAAAQDTSSYSYYTEASYAFSVECVVKPPVASAEEDETTTEGEATNG